MDKNTLEHLLSSYNWWMGLSTVAVAIGILGEYVAHFIFEEEARRNKREMAVSILFGVLVLGGVVRSRNQQQNDGRGSRQRS